ncbi:MAG TPA: proton-conducting transporter membrane subunit, partial [Bacteroidales bacterium]|nr:proton-conducting transporter membrane subunit [Bacteroidales bacterium]
IRYVKSVVALVVSLITAYLSVVIFIDRPEASTPGDLFNGSPFNIFGISLAADAGRYAIMHVDNLSRFIILLAGTISFLIILYSLVYNEKMKSGNFYPWFLLTTGCSAGAVFSDNLLLFIFFWGILGITLYKLIPGKDEESSAAAKKTLILIGASDSIMLAGIAIIWKMTGTLNMSELSLTTDNALTVTAFIALAIGSFTKSGAFPFHSWVPDYTKSAPASSSALLPASLDKLLGIYFLARLTSGIFVTGKWITFILLLAGGITIITAVMMALVQHDYKRLLGFHAVSQVGYMILGFALGTPLGLAGGLFHMANNAIYKTGLFLSAGAVEMRTGKNTIDDLGGLSKSMPVTFICSLIFAMSISGVPPFNGFSSKWMIYQGIIEFGTGPDFTNRLWILWLGLAVLGSALTLASFIKFAGGIFLGRVRSGAGKIKEVPALMWIPVVLLALACVLTGVFATGYVVPEFLMPSSGVFHLPGFWNSSLVSLLVLISLALGIIIYLATGIKKFRTDDSFIGGEKDQDETGYHSPEFYKTISEFRFFSWMYRKAGDRFFDIYDISKQFVLNISHMFSSAHTGVLPGYVIWACAGLIIMLLIMI